MKLNRKIFREIISEYEGLKNKGFCEELKKEGLQFDAAERKLSMERNQRSVRYTAKEIFKRGYREYRSSFAPGGVPESKIFFVKLRNAVINELETTGFCELLDELIERGAADADIVVYAAFADIAEGYRTDRLTDVDSDPIYSRYIPYVEKGSASHFGMTEKSMLFRWGEIEAMNYRRLAMGTHGTEMLRTVRKTVRGEHVRRLNGSSAVPAKPPEKTECEAAENLTKITENKASEEASELVKRYVAGEQKRYKRELNDEMAKFTQSILEETKRAASVHEEMCDATNAFQAEWIRALDDAQTKLNSIKEEFYAHLHKWQVSLYPSEIRPLAERYLELYRIINVDKLLREEVVFRSGTKQAGAESGGAGAVTEEHNTDGCSSGENIPLDSTIDGLNRLNKTLSKFMRRFEASLNGLDLYVYYPQEGVMFDELWHVPEDEETEYTGKKIAECLVPGIAKKANDNHGDDVLIPAVVRAAAEN